MRSAVSVATVLLVAALVLMGAPPAAAADALTRVRINGVMTPVHFNDGDSFRIQSGTYSGVQTRLSGYNSLESFGPVHSWGTWTPKELYAIAKLATLTARRGSWSCDGDGTLDSYGRLLLFCRDLAKDLISKGLAHAYSVDEQPADPELLAVQREAQRAKLGMWAHGVPRFIMTSLHSKAEGGGKNGETSNRLISTRDGHSDKWTHDDDYKECQKVCHEIPAPNAGDLAANLAVMRADPALAPLLTDVPDEEAKARAAALLAAVDEDWTPIVQARVGAKDKAPQAALARLREDKKLTMTGKQIDSCQIYVDFRRRFGGDRAVCLR